MHCCSLCDKCCSMTTPVRCLARCSTASFFPPPRITPLTHVHPQLVDCAFTRELLLIAIYAYTDAALNKDKRVSYVSSLYPWIISAARLPHLYHLPDDFDAFFWTIPNQANVPMIVWWVVTRHLGRRWTHHRSLEVMINRRVCVDGLA